jgi:hypothetical protein
MELLQKSLDKNYILPSKNYTESELNTTIDNIDIGYRKVFRKLGSDNTKQIVLYSAVPINGNNYFILYKKGDYVELMVFQTSGGDLNINATLNYSPEFTITRVP